MKVVGIIPARYDSKRLPGKPLLKKTGKYLIQHVYERAQKAKKLDHLIVATDDKRILSAVKSFGGKSILTSKNHPSGTHRVAEVASRINCKIVINIQGDEPEIEPKIIDNLVDLITDLPVRVRLPVPRQTGTQTGKGVEFATLAMPFENMKDFNNSNKVKVIIDNQGYAIYFSRSPIPYMQEKSFNNYTPLLHIGIYGYRKDFLLKFVSLPQGALEKVERLEQLRAIENGYKIKVGVVHYKSFGGIDTKEDYEKFVARYRNALHL